MQLDHQGIAFAFHDDATHGALDTPNHGLRGEDAPGSMTYRACLRHGLQVALPHALTRHLHKTEVAHRERLRAGAIAAEMCAQLLQYLVAIALHFHIDEVGHDDAADVAKPEL